MEYLGDDHSYGIGDFFKPSFAELIFFVYEFPASVVAAFAGNILSDGDIGVTIASGLIPQALTYIGFRVLESGAFVKGVYGKGFRDLIRGNKEFYRWGKERGGSRSLERKINDCSD